MALVTDREKMLPWHRLKLLLLSWFGIAIGGMIAMGGIADFGAAPPCKIHLFAVGGTAIVSRPVWAIYAIVTPLPVLCLLLGLLAQQVSRFESVDHPMWPFRDDNRRSLRVINLIERATLIACVPVLAGVVLRIVTILTA